MPEVITHLDIAHAHEVTALHPKRTQLVVVFVALGSQARIGRRGPGIYPLFGIVGPGTAGDGVNIAVVNEGPGLYRIVEQIERCAGDTLQQEAEIETPVVEGGTERVRPLRIGRFWIS